MREVATLTLSGLHLIAGCGAGEPFTVIRADSMGVQVVESRENLPELSWTIDTVRVFGGDEGGAASFYRVRRALVDVDDRGVIYVLDPSVHRVTAFTPEGEPLRHWGRQGQGPGELEYPISVTLDDRRNVLVHEASRGALVRYAPDGELLDERVAPRVISTIFRHVEAVPEGILMWDREPYEGTDDRMDRLLLRSGASETFLVEGRPSYSSTAHWPACNMTFTTTVPLSPRTHWSEFDGVVAVAVSSDFAIDVFEGGRLTRRSIVGDPVQEITEGAAISLLGKNGTRGPCNSTAREFVGRHGFHARPQLIRDLAVAPGGRVWAEFWVDAGNTRIAVFDSTGAPIGILSPTFPTPLTFLPDGRGLIQVTDSFDVERLGVVVVTSDKD